MKKNYKKILKQLFNLLLKYKLSFIIIFVTTIVASLFNIVGPKLLGNALTIIYDGVAKKSINFDSINNILLFLLILYVISFLFSSLSSIILTYVINNMSYSLRTKMIIKINKLPLSYFDKYKTGDTLSKLTNDVNTLFQSLEQFMSQFLSSFITLIGSIIIMLSISKLLTLIVFIILPLTIFSSSFIIKKSQKYFKKQQIQIGDLNGHIEEVYTGLNIISAFNAQEKMTNKFENFNQELYTSNQKSQFYSGLMMPVIHGISNLNYIIITILGGYLVIIGRIMVGDILSFIQYSKNFSRPLMEITQTFSLVQTAMASYERISEFLNETEEVDLDTLELPKIINSIEFKNVSFSYNDNLVIDKFNLKINKGDKIAIVGKTGSGKTTIIKLLMRFYDVIDGELLINNVNITKYNRNELRQLFGMVLQDTVVYNNTIKENIRYGNLTASDDDVIEVAKKTQLDHFINTLDNSYNTILNDDSDSISQGQKQLLTISRAMISNPQILILDEATSNVDTRTELLIGKALDNIMKNKTSLIIAHRLSTIKNADKIIVMDKGKIVESGNHTELLSLKGKYEKLYNTQFKK